MNNDEKELKFLLNTLPKDIDDWTKEYLADTYIPEDVDHPQIRLRQRGEKYFLTKKYPLNPSDSSNLIEETINLSKEEYDYLKKSIKGKFLAKNRYKKIIGETVVEIDEYLEKMSPLIIIDFEWMDIAPDQEFISQFDIGIDLSQNKELSAGMLAGKTYQEIEAFIK